VSFKPPGDVACRVFDTCALEDSSALNRVKMSSSLPRLQPPAAVVLHDLLHRPAGAPRRPRHERVPEEVRLGVGRVLPDSSLPDHSGPLLRSPDSSSTRYYYSH